MQESPSYNIGSSSSASEQLPARPRVRDSLKWKILAIALLSVAGLSAFVGLMLYDSHLRVKLLKDIQEHRYPVQAQLLSAVHTLEVLHRELETAVITGDEDGIEATHALAREFHAQLNRVQQIHHAYSGDVVDLLAQFDRYYSYASRLALQFLNPFMMDEGLTRQGRENAGEYRVLMARLIEFQTQRNIDFTDSIHATSARARDTVRLGISSGILVISLVLVMALITANGIIRRIREMVQTLKRIATEDGDLKARIKLGGRDEMSELAYWFNSFIQQLDETNTHATNEIWRIANTDALSGLANRRFLTRWVQNIPTVMKQSSTPDNEAKKVVSEFTVLFLDLDDFKPINDQLGHEAGDQLIAAVAQRLYRTVTGVALDSSVAGWTGFENGLRGVVGRLGGDEFMVILPGISAKPEIRHLAEKILNCLTETYLISGTQCRIGVSIGISRYPIDGDDQNMMLDRADTAMYEAKQAGKNRYLFYNARMEQELCYASEMERQLKNPEICDEFRLVFQPKFSLLDGRCNGAEALIRWHSDTLGQISPSVFVPFAEQRQLIRVIDYWVIEEVCRQLSLWTAQQLLPVRVSLNVSALTIQEENLPAILAAATRRHGVVASDLEIEITESSVIDVDEALISNIAGLRKIGVRLAMDDFGAGHSSLKLLMENQIDTIKIDKSLIDDVDTDRRRQKIVHSIIALSKTLDVTTLAEGIEDKSQWDYLRAVGCADGQGFYFSRPLEVQAFAASYLRPQLRLVVGG